MKFGQKVLSLERLVSKGYQPRLDVITRANGETLPEALATIGRVPNDYIGKRPRRLIEVVYVVPHVT